MTEIKSGVDVASASSNTTSPSGGTGVHVYAVYPVVGLRLLSLRLRDGGAVCVLSFLLLTGLPIFGV